MTIATTLRLRWSISRGRDTYGYNICTVIDERTGKRYSCNGGGYDMTGTSFGHWLTDVRQSELRALAAKHGVSTEHRGQVKDFYGMYQWEPDGPVVLDGACGLESMMRVARAVGLGIERTYVEAGAKRGETTGWVITDPTVHTFTVTVSGCTAEQAEQVMAERLGHDEDYGFDYQIDYQTTTPKEGVF